jgi:predicted RND superfamily exporter protein
MNVDTVMQSLSRWIIRHRWALLSVILLITAALAYSTKDLVVDNDFDNWLPENDRVSKLYRLVDEQFSSNALVFVVLDCTERGVFDPESLRLVQRLTDSLEAIDELFNVSSLTNIIDIRKTDFGLEVGDLIPEIPESTEDLDALKAYVLSKEMYVNSLVSEDAAYTVIVTNIEGNAEEVAVAAKIIGIVEEVAGDHPYYFGGEAALHLYADKYMNQDLATLTPVMLVVMIAILAVSFRRFWGVVLPLGLVVLGILWTFGLQARLGIAANVFTPTTIVLLIAMGTDYSVHIYNHYMRRGDIRVSTAQITLPVVMSAATTIAGLLTFGFTRIDLLRFFGLVLALGLGVACLLSIVLLPICIYLFRAKPAPVDHREDQQEQILSKTLIRIGVWVHRNSRTTMAATLIGLVVMGFGIFRITTNVDFSEFMPKDSPPRLGLNALRDHFSGAYPISLYFRGDMEDPALMQMQDYLENYMRSYDLISGFKSINGLIAEENWLMNGVFAVPETREGIANLWLLLEGEEFLRTFVDADRHQSLVAALVKRSESDVMRSHSRAVWDYLDSHVPDQVVEIDPARLSPEGLQALRRLQMSETARQLAWLAQSYDKPRMYDANLFLKGLEERFPEIDRTLDLEPVWTAGRTYLEEETVEILPPELIGRLMALLQENVQKLSTPELHDRLAGVIAASKVMDAEDAASTATGVLNRAASVLRIRRASSLRASMAPLVSPELAAHKDFQKRADGVLWRLWTERPVFFSSRIESIPEIDRAAVVTKPIRVDQTGMADLIRRFDDLIYLSQFQSMILASLIVLVLVSLTQRSLRRGLISLASVLVPMVFIMGLMGWTKIPLDFGTALFGALIIGLGVDGSIHFLHHYHDLELRGIRGEEALRRSMGHVGKAIVTANATTCCGFLVLMFSNTAILRNFAIVNAIAISLVTLSLLTFMPALVTLFHKDNSRDQGSGIGDQGVET